MADLSLLSQVALDDDNQRLRGALTYRFFGPRAAPAARITHVEVRPELATGKVRFRVHTDGAAGNPKATIVATGRTSPC